MEKIRDKKEDKVSPFVGEVVTLYIDLVKNVTTGNTGKGTLTSDPHQSGVAKDIEARLYIKDTDTDEIKLVHSIKAHNRSYAMPNIGHQLSNAMLNSKWASHV